MTKYAFLNMPGYGHVNPTLAVAQELVQRGQEVIYYLPEEFKEAVEATGATFRGYDSSLMSKILIAASFMGPKGVIQGGPMAMMVDESRHVLPQVLERIRADQPDVILYESMCVWANITAQVLHIPTINLYPSYAMNEHFNFWKERVKGIVELCEEYHVPPFDLHSAGRGALLSIVFIPEEFQLAGESFDESYVFVGPSILPRTGANDFPLDKLNGERPVLYISLGTAFNNQPEFFKMCFEAFGGQDWQVVLSRGRSIDAAALGLIPDNFLVSPYVPQLEVLPRAQVFVTHGGMNSTMESLYYGVPMVAIPQMPEQRMNAQQATDRGFAIMLEKEKVNVEVLREAVNRVANEPSFCENVQKMKQSIQNAGGYRRAADAIMQASQEHAGGKGGEPEQRGDVIIGG